MKSKKELVQDAFNLANETIPTSKEHIYVAFEKVKDLAKYYKADEDIVLIGIYLMDYKLKEARKLGKKQEHVNMAVQFAKDFLNNYNITKDEKEKIIIVLKHIMEKFLFNVLRLKFVLMPIVIVLFIH